MNDSNETPLARPVSEQESTPFNFWWPASEIGARVMLAVLGVIGLLALFKGLIDEGDSRGVAETIAKVLFFYCISNVVGWYLIFNIGRFVYSQVHRSDTVETVRTMREKAELESLRRKVEIKQLREQLGDDDREEQP